MSKYPRKPKLADAERHKRFVDMAKEVGASEEAPGFDDALKKVALTRPGGGRPRPSEKRRNA
jgi:hypothetical protein